MRQELEELKDAELSSLDSDIQKVHTMTSEYAALLREKRWIRTKLDAALLDAENCAESLLKIFRDANLAHRRDAQRPAYFDTKPRLQPLAMPDFGADDDRSALADQERLVERLTNAVTNGRASVQAAFTTQSEKLKPIEGHIRLA